ncbi:MAG TPA: hypothetical protein VMQ73_08740, partial [Methylomirabilota bacterium]|nr:hypothetical protein [Methylomirabilota bacterium]
QPSSSATIIGNDVKTPSPISDWATRMITLSSGSTTIQALISRASPGAARQHDADGEAAGGRQGRDEEAAAVEVGDGGIVGHRSSPSAHAFISAAARWIAARRRG